MRARISTYSRFNDDGLIDVYADKDMLIIILNCLEEKISYMCEPETYDKMIELISDYQSIADKMSEPIGEKE